MMMVILKRYGYLVFFILLISCGNSRQLVSAKADTRENRELAFEHQLLDEDLRTVEMEDEPTVDLPYKTQVLNNFIKEWEGTPHKMGGNTKKGVDCSGLVCQAYQEVYSISFMGRSAAQIFNEVIPVKRDELIEGDLVFFKIHKNRINHVGIYLKGGDFVHTSSSRGVMISNLDEPYYKERFYMGGRKI